VSRAADTINCELLVHTREATRVKLAASKEVALAVRAAQAFSVSEAPQAQLASLGIDSHALGFLRSLIFVSHCLFFTITWSPT
jgi:hypothetical protein